MSILPHFDVQDIAEGRMFKLKPAERNVLLAELPKEYLACYIKPFQLKKCAKQNGMKVGEFLNHFVIPDSSKGNIRAGDFGEMLCYLIVKEHYSLEGITLAGPKKWHWKSDKNKAAQGSDVILFHFSKDGNTENDMVVTLESKMKSVQKNDYHPIENAIEGAHEDQYSRMVKSLHWFSEKLAKDGRPRLRERLDRFKNPARYGRYRKVFKAMAVIDSGMVDEEIAKPITNNHENIPVWVVSVDDLKEAYEQVFLQIPNC